ncbi:hypothetical protein K438DRAFT_1771861 [Mycena galopus ATCC 62051]|nr:hypothetical protein K438DRAFT_1771861 [Mycena galopus ATCC 62051]
MALYWLLVVASEKLTHTATPNLSVSTGLFSSFQLNRANVSPSRTEEFSHFVQRNAEIPVGEDTKLRDYMAPRRGNALCGANPVWVADFALVLTDLLGVCVGPLPTRIDVNAVRESYSTRTHQARVFMCIMVGITPAVMHQIAKQHIIVTRLGDALKM